MTRYTVVHDNRGNILALAAYPADAPTAQIQVQPGQRLSEVEVQEEGLSLDSPQLTERLADLIRNKPVEKGTSQ